MVSEVIYDIIRRPVVTEKSTILGEDNKIVFMVNINSDKLAIKKAVEALFNVKVEAVNTIKMKGKVKRFKGKLGTRNAYKKAIITLVEGESVDVMAGI